MRNRMPHMMIKRR